MEYHDISSVFHSKTTPQKQVYLGGIFMVYSALFWYFVRFLFENRVFGAGSMVAVAAAGILWIILLAFIMVFARKRFAYLNYGVLTLILLLFFGFREIVFVGIIIFALILWIAHIRAARIKSYLADFNAWLISRKSLSLFFTGLAVFMAFVYHGFIFAEEGYDLHITPEVHHVMFAPVDFFLDTAVPGYERGMTVAEFQDILLNTFIQNFAPQQGQLSPGTSAQLVDENIANQTLEEFTRTWINNTIETTLTPYRDLLPLIFAIGLFSVFRFLMWPLMWLSIGFFMLAIRGLLLYNILEKREIEIVKEIPVLE